MMRASRLESATPQTVLLAVVCLLSMSVWFSASALVPQLRLEWGLSGTAAAWLTMSVQIGFVVGAVGSALANLPDRMSPGHTVALGALGAAMANALIPVWADTALAATLLRFVTGGFMALVYPPAMKLMASWCRETRGLCIGVLVGALTVGSALPHLLAALPILSTDGGLPPWRTVMLATSLQSFIAAILALIALRTGPHVSRATRFDWRNALAGLREPAPRLANLGYFGHMWELYAMWAWLPVALLGSYEAAGWSEQAARGVAFLAMAIGGFSSIVAGRWADRLGRTRVTSAAMLVSGACAITAGFVVGNPLLLSIVAMIWGFAVIADSAQFSAAVSELADPAYVGTALTVQTAVGFLLTMISIQLVPILVDWSGWGLAFSMLALGPAVGTVSMLRLRRRPEARAMAMGNR